MTQLTHTLDADQRRALENVRAAAERIWASPLHRYYTDHTTAHSERIVTLLDGLTAGMMATPKRLSSTEVYVLLAAAYLHDIGMQNERFADGDSSTSSERRLDEIRAHHNELTAEMIYAVIEDPANAFDIPLARDPAVVEATALVAEGHRRVDLSSADYDPLPHGNETLRLRLLAALLRFGDELDIDHRRVDVERMKLLNLPEDSQVHWWKCHYVGGLNIADEFIRIAYRFPRDRPDYEEFIVPLVERDVRAKLAALEEVFRANAVKVAVGRSQVRLMRLLQPLPPGVEALAREMAAAHSTAPSPAMEAFDQRGQIVGERLDVGRADRPSASSARPAPVYDQRRQIVGSQINVAGDYSATGVAESHPPAARETPTSPNTDAVRELLNAALGDGDLNTLCFDYFRPVYEVFSSGMDKGQKIQRLLDYCYRHEQWDKLLAIVREHNPAKYRRFRERLP
jgi:HD superfamily phosphodiesterase